MLFKEIGRGEGDYGFVDLTPKQRTIVRSANSIIQSMDVEKVSFI
jgi:hypothetical protein